MKFRPLLGEIKIMQGSVLFYCILWKKDYLNRCNLLVSYGSLITE